MTQGSLFEVETSISFLEEVWHKIAGSHADPENTYIILPSVRAGLFYKNIYRKNSSASLILPNITTMHSFVDQFSELETLDSNSALFELYHCYRTIPNEKLEGFPEFYKWAKLLLNDFNEIDNYLIDAAHLFSNLQNLKELEDWSFNSDVLSGNQQQFISFWDKLLPLYKAFDTHLHTLGKAYSGKKVRRFAENMDNFIDTNPNIETHFIGFNALNRAEELIIEGLGSSGMAKVFWDIDPYYHQNPNQEAGKFFPQKGKTSYYHFIEGGMKTQHQNIEIIGVPKSVGQVKTAANILSQTSPTEVPKTAVILANESLLLPFLNSLPDNIKSANLTMGFPIKFNPLYTLLEAVFRFNSSTGQALPVGDIKQITEHQYLKNKSAENVELTELLNSRRFVSKENLQGHCKTNLEKIIFQDWEGNVETSAAAIRLLLIQLKELYNELGLSDLENEFLFETTKTLNKVARLLDNNLNLIDLSIFQRIFFDDLKKQKVAFIGEPIAGLQIMGMLETRALDFDNLIILGANEGVMPASPSESSLVPGDLKKHYGLPTHEKREAIYAYYVYRLLHRSKKVSFVYNNVVDDLGGSEKSRFLLQLMEELPKVNKNVSISQRNVWGKTSPDPVIAVSINKNQEILEKIKQQLIYGVSPTALSTFIECPLNFYYKYVIGLSEADSKDEVSASEFGSIVHRIIELAFEGMEGKILDEAFYKQVLANQNTLAEQALHDVLKSKHIEGKTLISLELAKYQFKRLMETERSGVLQKSKEGKLTTFLASEKTMEFQHDLLFNGEIIPVKIKGKIDRIHKTGNTLWVVDYKTGALTDADLKIASFDDLAKSEKRKALQLAIYGIALRKEYSGFELMTGIISTIKPLEEPQTLQMNKETVVYSPENIEEIEGVIQGILSNMLDANQPLQHLEKAKYCNYCN